MKKYRFWHMGLLLLTLVFGVFHIVVAIAGSETPVINKPAVVMPDANNVIQLSKGNFISIVSDIKPFSSELSNASRQILDPDSPSLLILDSPGGDLDALISLIWAMRSSGKEFTCVALRAASSAFVLFMECKHRFVLEFSELMHHRVSFVAVGGHEKYLSYTTSIIESVEKPLLARQAKILNMSLDAYLALLNNNLYWYGSAAVKANLAHKVVSLRCDKELIKTTKIIEREDYQGSLLEMRGSECPLVIQSYAPSSSDGSETNTSPSK
jgi:ATP-dependent protease ClpP protease subunit